MEDTTAIPELKSLVCAEKKYQPDCSCLELYECCFCSCPAVVVKMSSARSGWMQAAVD